MDSSIPERSDIRSDTKSGSGTQSGLPLNLAITVGSYSSSGTCANISGAQVHTQLFFADSISTAVYSANSTYSRSGTRDTVNALDSVYNEESPALLVSLTGDATSGYAGTVSIGILEGTIYGG